MNKKSGIKDITKLAKISIGTFYRALHNKERIPQVPRKHLIIPVQNSI